MLGPTTRFFAIAPLQLVVAHGQRRTGVPFAPFFAFLANIIHAVPATDNAGEQALIKYGNQIPPYQDSIHYVPSVLQFCAHTSAMEKIYVLIPHDRGRQTPDKTQPLTEQQHYVGSCINAGWASRPGSLDGASDIESVPGGKGYGNAPPRSMAGPTGSY